MFEGKGLHAAIEQLIELNQQFRCSFRPAYQGEAIHAATNYAMDSATVHCDIGRQTGKTAFIKSQLPKGNSIAVCDIKLKPYFNSDRAYSVGDVLTHACDAVDYDTVFIDNARVLLADPKTKYLVYKYLAKNQETTFVLLG